MLFNPNVFMSHWKSLFGINVIEDRVKTNLVHSSIITQYFYTYSVVLMRWGQGANATGC